MISPDDIQAKAVRHYVPRLRSWLRGEPYAPRRFAASAPPTEYQALATAVATLLQHAKGQRGWGYQVERRAKHAPTRHPIAANPYCDRNAG